MQPVSPDGSVLNRDEAKATIRRLELDTDEYRRAELVFFKKSNPLVKELFTLTPPGRLVLVGVERVTNDTLLDLFEMQKAALEATQQREAKKRDPASDLYIRTSEEWAFHGTHPDHIQSICNRGLRIRKTEDKKTDYGWYGQGLYFSGIPEYAAPYSRPNRDLKMPGVGDTVKLIVFKVVLGACHKLKSRLRPGEGAKEGYHSHRTSNWEEIVLFDEAMCVPHYIFELRTAHSPLIELNVCLQAPEKAAESASSRRV